MAFPKSKLRMTGSLAAYFLLWMSILLGQSHAQNNFVISVTGVPGSGETTWSFSGSSTVSGSDNCKIDDADGSNGSGWLLGSAFYLGASTQILFTSATATIYDGTTSRALQGVGAADIDVANRFGFLMEKSGASYSTFTAGAVLTFAGEGTVPVDINQFTEGTYAVSDWRSTTTAVSLPVTIHVFQPSASPSSAPSSAPVVGGGAGGDPHIQTWSGQHYDFHGHCDLVLLHSEKFGGGKGLSVHIRNSPIKTIFSYISDAVIKIGDDVLEIQGGGKYFLNGIPQEMASPGTTVAGYALTSSKTKKGRCVYKIDLGGVDGKQQIIFREFRDWITISLFHGTSEDFGDSVGLMATYSSGLMLGRDGTTLYTDNTDEFGKQWQVRGDTDGNFFQKPSPFPGKCHMPDQETKKRAGRRLGESAISRGEAMKACAHWGSQAEDCARDVQITEDLDMALNSPI